MKLPEWRPGYKAVLEIGQDPQAVQRVVTIGLLHCARSAAVSLHSIAMTLAARDEKYTEELHEVLQKHSVEDKT